MDGNTFRQIAANIADRLAGVLDNLEQYPVRNNPPTQWSVDEVLAEIDESLPTEPGNVDRILDRFFGRYVPTSFNTTSHGYLAYIPGGGIPDAALADLMSDITNRFVTVWQAAPAMAKIESTVIRWFGEIMGMPAGAGGFLTTGGSQANLSALIAARVRLMDDDFSGWPEYIPAHKLIIVFQKLRSWPDFHGRPFVKFQSTMISRSTSTS